jgi:two-component system CheB/CheR fusion protein
VATGVNGDVKFWGGAAARIWGLSDKEVVGKKLSSLGLAGLSGDLLIEKTAAVREGRRDREAGDGLIPIPGAADPMTVSVEVSCLRNAAKQLIGLLYVVHDVTALRALERDMRRVNEELRLANEKLQVANEELQATNEELETTNEELQSANEELQTTNEELQTTNEELQSANEELETTNEELQSTNVELDATNRELAHRTEEMNLLGFYHRTIIRSLSAAIVILDSDGRITIWNIAAERLLGLAEAEALGQILWTLRVPALPRPIVLRIRNLLREDRPFRADNVEYDLPTGGRGYANLAALPLLEGKSRMGAAIIFEDVTRFARFAERRLRLKGKAGGPVKELAAKADADGSKKDSEGATAKRRAASAMPAKALPAAAPTKAGSGKRQKKTAKDGAQAAKAQSVKGGRERRIIEAGANGAGSTIDTEIALLERGESGRGGGNQ